MQIFWSCYLSPKSSGRRPVTETESTFERGRKRLSDGWFYLKKKDLPKQALNH